MCPTRRYEDADGLLFGEPDLSECPQSIAITGLGCRWPGAVQDPSQLWELLKAGKSGYSEFLDERIHLDGFYHPDPHRSGTFHSRGGYFLQEDPKLFDHSFFGISALETATMDPAQRKLLEVTFEAFESAGEPWSSFSGARIGVFVGNFNNDHGLMNMKDTDQINPYATTGTSVSILSNRISFVFNLKGPSLTVDTACSSSMYALHLAVSSIRNGDCDAAIVAGSNLIMSPELQLYSSKLGALSSTSTCHTFDAAADGYARGEGVAALYIKPVSAALQYRNPIRAVIRGTAVNANGRGSGITHPNSDAQVAVIRQAFKSAGHLSPDLVGYVECHGTGTPVGDPLEVKALGRHFSRHRRSNKLLIGSVKTNLGHTESSSGIAGIMKVILAMENGVIPPTIGISQLNPQIDFDSLNVEVVTKLQASPSLPIIRASINSFGFGGANAHFILDSTESFLSNLRSSFDRPLSSCTNGHSAAKLVNGDQSVTSNESETFSLARKLAIPADDAVNANNLTRESKTERCTNPIDSRCEVNEQNYPDHIKSSKSKSRLMLLPFSAADDLSLEKSIQSISDALHEFDLRDVAYTLCVGRTRFFNRSFAVMQPGEALDLNSLHRGKALNSQKVEIGFVFTGQGAQAAGMGYELLREYSPFRQSIRHMDAALSTLSCKPSWLIEDLLSQPSTAERLIDDPIYSQTLCTAIQIALVDLLESFDVHPTCAIGHSSGEIAAAYAAGIHSSAQAIVLAYFRGLAVSQSTDEGSMLAAGMAATDALRLIKDIDNSVTIAAYNSPRSITLSGDKAAILQLHQLLKECDVAARILRTGNRAYHSSHMLKLGPQYEDSCRLGSAGLSPDIQAGHRAKRDVFWYSSVDGRMRTSGPTLDVSYWRKNLESPVLFTQAVEAAFHDDNKAPSILVEIGPHSALQGPLNQILKHLFAKNSESQPAYLPSLQRAAGEFSRYKNVSFKRLDIGADPLEQGFHEKYDLVISSQCLHATVSMVETLRRVRSLCKEGGKLLILECTSTHDFTTLAFGLFPDFWNGVPEGRVDGPFLNRMQWNEVFKATGFSGLDIVLDDFPEPYCLVSTMLTTAIDETPFLISPSHGEILGGGPAHTISLLCLEQPPRLAHILQTEFSKAGTNCEIITLSQMGAICDGRVISLLDSKESPLLYTDETGFAALKSLLLNAKTILWVSDGGLAGAARPSAALFHGLATTMSIENASTRIAVLDLDVGFEEVSDKTITTIMERERACFYQLTSCGVDDKQVIINAGYPLVSRIVPEEELNHRYLAEKAHKFTTVIGRLGDQPPLELDFHKPGVLDSFYFRKDVQFSSRLGADDVELQVYATGLTNHDVAVATARFDGCYFSLESAGVVRSVGANVRTLQPGDSVWGFAPGRLGNYARTKECFLQKMNSSYSYTEMATLPISFLTAVYGLLHVARLEQGQSVLIHSALGGLGMAAISIARYVGADIFATVGTAEKARTLKEDFGIPETRIFLTRDASTPSKLLQATEYRGVDVILSSVAGDLMHDMWRCIAPLGHFIEVGRREIHGKGSLQLDVFRRNATFSSFDIELLFTQKPSLGSSLLQEVNKYLKAGVIKPLNRIRVFTVSEFDLAILHFGARSRTGKIVFSFEDPDSLVKIRPTPEKIQFDLNAAYLLIGCLDGLGKAVNRWMVDRHARYLYHMSRRGDTDPAVQEIKRELSQRGVSMYVVQGDVSKKEDVEKLVAYASVHHSVKGVINSAMILEDISFEHLSYKQFHRVLGPKVQGNINLDEATLGLPLDFFVMMSSIVTLVGSATQSAYCAASGFQDTFARWRLIQGLPTCSFAFGVISGIGTAEKRSGVLRTMTRNGLYETDEKEFLNLFQAAFVRGSDSFQSADTVSSDAHLITGLEPGKLANVRQRSSTSAAEYYWTSDPRLGIIMQAVNNAATKHSDTSQSKNSLAELQQALSDSGKLRSVTLRLMIERLSKLLFITPTEIDPDKSIGFYGMDSMVSAELRSWMWQIFRLDISFLELADHNLTISDLAERAKYALSNSSGLHEQETD